MKIPTFILDFFNLQEKYSHKEDAKEMKSKNTKTANSYPHIPKRDYTEIQAEWEAKIDELGIPRVHPSYNEDEEFVMRFRTAGDLRFAEPDKENLAPHYLILRESMRRLIKGWSTRKNNYPKLVVRSFERMEEELLNENAKELGENYCPRANAVKEKDRKISKKRKFGEKNEQGLLWSPSFRRFYPHEEFLVIGKIDRLYTEWGQGTYKDGIKAGVNVGKLRVQRKLDGTAAELILKHKLPVDKFLDKLMTGFIGRPGKKA